MDRIMVVLKKEKAVIRPPFLKFSIFYISPQRGVWFVYFIALIEFCNNALVYL